MQSIVDTLLIARYRKQFPVKTKQLFYKNDTGNLVTKLEMFLMCLVMKYL